MINSKKDYISYLEADRIALGKPKYTFQTAAKEYIKRDLIWRFQRMLRKSEYHKNVLSKKSIFYKIIYFIIKIRFKNLSMKLGFTIPENVFGKGLAILHYGTIVVNRKTIVGDNCRLHACTNIGESGGVAGAPKIGKNVYIGPGAKIYGAIEIADNCVIAANAAVNKSIVDKGMLVGGIPAKIIGAFDVSKLIKHIT